jgi:hypothetical protein
MNPNREGPASFELPTPSTPEDETRQEQAVEAPPAQPEQVGKQAKQPALPKVPDDIPAVDKPLVAAPPQDVKRSVPSDPHVSAGDSERIEPIWVNKVKDIELHTVDDPHTRTVEMSKVKAEYKLKRFNKQVKSDEAAA